MFHQLLLPARLAASAATTRAVLACLAVIFLPTLANGDEGPGHSNGALFEGWMPSFWLTQEYRGRFAGSAEMPTASPLGPSGTGPVSDHDLRLTLDGSLVGMGGHLAAVASVAWWLDLDGPPPSDREDVFGDTRGWTRSLSAVYTAVAEVRRSGPLSRLAVGRQQSIHGMPVTFDGGSLDLRLLERRITLFALGGRTVHFFESGPGFFENWLVGGGAGLRLGSHFQMEADSRYLHEVILGQGGVTGERVNTNSYGVTLMGRWDDFQAKAFARGMNRTFSHVGGTLHLQVPRAGLGIDGQATAQLATLGEIAESESPYFSMLGNSLPHLRARLEAWKDFPFEEQGALVFALGTRVRQLLHDQPERFNRNTNALYARIDLNDKPFKGAFASASADWNLPTRSDDPTGFLAAGGSVGYLSRKARCEAGTYFQRFKVNYYQDAEELTDVRTVFAMASYRLFSRLEVRGRYVLEILDRTIQSTYLTLREDF